MTSGLPAVDRTLVPSEVAEPANHERGSPICQAKPISVGLFFSFQKAGPPKWQTAS